MNDLVESAAWLTRDRVTRIAVVSGVAGLALLLFLLVTSRHTVDLFGRPLGTDFSVFWNAGHLANLGRAPDAWNPTILNATAHATHGADVGDSAWLYPPIFLLVAGPLARLPYTVALIVWQLASLAALALALSRILPTRRALLVGLASPLTPMVLGHGQNAFLTAALLGGGLALRSARETAGGGLIGALVYKPQLALMIGPFLLLGRRWRAIAAALAVTVLLVSISLLLWGVESWQAFFASLRLGRGFMEHGSVGFYKSASLFAMARQWGATIPLGYGVQAVGAAGGLWLIWRLRGAPTGLQAAGLCAALALSTPYLLDYDMATVGIGAAFLYAAVAAGDFLPYERFGLALVWGSPWFARPAAQYLTLPLGPIAMILLAALTVRRAQLTASPSRH